MLRSLFGRGKKRPAAPATPIQSTIRDARVGDVVVIQGFALEYDDCYLVVENIHRYGGSGIVWYEVVVADLENRLWLEWSEDGAGLHVTATDNRRPVGLESIGLTEPELLDLDASRSIDRSVAVDGLRYMYRNSFEAFYFRDNRPTDGEGFYLWEFLAEDESKVLSITKFEEAPFEAHFAETISSENVLLYPGERPEQRSR
jgi:hypothetical protein